MCACSLLNKISFRGSRNLYLRQIDTDKEKAQRGELLKHGKHGSDISLSPKQKGVCLINQMAMKWHLLLCALAVAPVYPGIYLKFRISTSNSTVYALTHTVRVLTQSDRIGANVIRELK